MVNVDPRSNVRRVETMMLQGNQYAKVVTRLREFHSTVANGKIETFPEFKEGWVMFRAVVTPDAVHPDRFFTGHSMGKVGGGAKAFEKLESIAVGRALSFAGFLSTGEIASYEEMEDAGLRVSAETIDPETGEVTGGSFAALKDKLDDGAGVSPPATSKPGPARLEISAAPQETSVAASFPPLKNARGSLIVANVAPWALAADKKMGDLYADRHACDALWDELRPVAELIRSKKLQDPVAAGAIESLFRAVAERVEARQPVPLPV